ncbi:hypothetical protein HUJ04_011620 [Dendroctonus ponderosae]|nr:hypothetical protein HUJ04_011620 [Dendroctonus ponderosae]
MDESGLTTVQKKSQKVYAAKGRKQVGALSSAERGQHVTIVCAMNAIGTYVPPALIFPRQRMTDQLMNDSLIGNWEFVPSLITDRPIEQENKETFESQQIETTHQPEYSFDWVSQESSEKNSTPGPSGIDHSVSVRDIYPPPVEYAIATSQKKCRKRGKTGYLNSTPEIEELKQKVTEKAIKIRKQEGRKVKKQVLNIIDADAEENFEAFEDDESESNLLICKDMGISQRPTPVYTPQANPVEPFPVMEPHNFVDEELGEIQKELRLCCPPGSHFVTNHKHCFQFISFATVTRRAIAEFQAGFRDQFRRRLTKCSFCPENFNQRYGDTQKGYLRARTSQFWEVLVLPWVLSVLPRVLSFFPSFAQLLARPDLDPNICTVHSKEGIIEFGQPAIGDEELWQLN